MPAHHFAYLSGFNNPYVQVHDSHFLVNADRLTVKRTKAQPTRPAIIRFLEKILVSENRFYNGSPCWEWRGCRQSNGYGQFKADGRRGAKKTNPHRFAYEYFNSEIPSGYEIDHCCQNRSCASPFHLEAITLQENRRRRGENQTRCKQGHEFTMENTSYTAKGTRRCKACNRERVAAFHAKHPGYNTAQCQKYQNKRKPI